MTQSRIPQATPFLGDIVACVGFYTRLPFPLADHDPDRFAAAQWAAPIAGAVVGALVAATLLLALAIGAPAGVAAGLALAAGIAATGALHEDGLADTVDGFGGGKTQADKLAIMRDSRIGTYGTLALVLSALLRWAGLSALALADGPVAFFAIVAAHGASRALIPCLMARVPSARRDGLSAGVGLVEGMTAAGALAIGAVLLLLAGFWFALVAAAMLALVFMLVERAAISQIGGQTGDVLGALQQVAEIALLALAAALMT